ncbi:uncharacterized protein LDX57_009824 [Aspergillus melleus]|uniref:uncharacterized protein n=1 Tax=Aspergillus melleus TaxID=138277 RepID=UPI001E8CCEDF|nr:uncharacterized protein LDX57_009824 [Aspergillus melleus]KAH8432185.1 hypothetical protein LDX57_009824 [Aspergillus melleus]
MPVSRSEGALSQTRAPNLLSLPIEARNRIYEQVLTVPHPLFLFKDPGCPVATFAPEKPRRWLSLLYTNRQISEEASVVLYGMNQFTLEEMETKNRRSGLLRSFLNCIGPVNAASLSHLCINFPAMEQIEGHSEGIRLEEDGLQTLQLLQRECTGLQTLELLLF